MKPKFLYLILLSLVTLSFQPSSLNDVVELPIKLIDGYGTLPAGFVRLGEPVTAENPLHDAIRQNLTGIPRTWSNVGVQFILLEPNQFIFQSYKQGLLDENYFNEFKDRRQSHFEKRPLSENRIKCLVYVIHGKDKNGILKHKIDANNNFDFSDELEYVPPEIDWSKLDSLANKFALKVKFETFRNGEIVELEASVLLLNLDNGFFGVNIPQHGEAELNGTKILITSQGFTTTDYDSVSIFNSNNINARTNEEESVIIGAHSYRNLGCDINKNVLLLRKLD